jgi:pimeloyl-ACP methyl ester carboxylesterase
MGTEGPRVVETNGLRFNVVDVGSGAPIILLHGFPDSSRLWRNQIPALVKAGFRCVAPDLRGFGESDKPGGVADYAMPLVLQDVTGIMDELEIERATIVGHDWGAGVGWLLASFIPERVERLVALSAGHPAGFVPPFLAQLQKSWYLLFFQFRDLAEERLKRDDWLLFREWLQGAPDSEVYLESLSEPGALTAGLNWYRANVPPESFAAEIVAFPPIEVPVMGIWGSGDPYLTQELMTRSAKFVAGPWRYERFEEVGHWIPLEQPERLNQLLLEFLSN